MFNSFKRALLRKTCSNIIFSCDKRNDLFMVLNKRSFSILDQRPKRITARRLDKLLDSKTQSIRKSTKNLEAKLKDLSSSQKPISIESVENLMNIFCRNGCVEKEFQLFVELINHELLDCEPQQRIGLMENLLLHIEELDIYHYNSLISVHLYNNVDFVPDEFLKDLRMKNIEPNRKTKYLIFKYYCTKGIINKAYEILQEEVQNNKSYSEKIYADLLIAHGTARNFERINEIKDLMNENNVMKKLDTYIALMCIYAMQNDIQAIKNIHKTCTSQSISISASDASKVLRMLLACGYQKSLPMGLEIFKSEKNPTHIFLFLTQLLTLGHEKLAIELWSENCNRALETDIIEDPYKYIFLQRLFRNTSNLSNTHHLLLEKCKEYNTLVQFQVLNGFARDGDLVKYKTYIEILVDENLLYLKPLHFWPLLAKCVKDVDLHGMLFIIDYMINQCGIQPCFDTMKNFIVPHIINNNYSINILRYLRVDEDVINNAIVYIRLSLFQLRKAFLYMQLHKSTYNYSLLSEVLVEAFVMTQDVYSFVKISRTLKDVNPAASKTEENEENITCVPLEHYILQIRQSFPDESDLVLTLHNELMQEKMFEINKTVISNRLSGEWNLTTLKPNIDQVSSLKSNNYTEESDVLMKLNSALRNLYGERNFVPTKCISEGTTRLTAMLKQLIEQNTGLLHFLEKYYTLTKCTSVGNALTKCRSSCLQMKLYLDPVRNLLEAGKIKEPLWKLKKARWYITGLMDDLQVEESDPLTRTLTYILKRYGPVAVLSILEYITSQYHFLPRDMVDLMTEFQNLESDEHCRKFVDIYEKFDKHRCYTDLVFSYLRRNQIKDATEVLTKLDMHSEYFESRVNEAYKNSNELINSLLEAYSRLPAEYHHSTPNIIMNCSP